MFRWMFFWRSKPSRGVEVQQAQVELSSVNPVEQNSKPEKQPKEVGLRGKGTGMVAMIRSITGSPLEAENHDDIARVPQPAEAVVRTETTDSFMSKRIKYFTPGAYAVPRLGGPVLTAPDLRLPGPKVQPGLALLRRPELKENRVPRA
ncbi:hypothetical protein RBB77_01565 [Tunturibacter psychrotolerans]|uniref:Uncharacterized protein n=1 Tax=Tunturiibacter psychrotolerans TaxID=3069686 RepID=A0AAU7ZRL9_9BACT